MKTRKIILITLVAVFLMFSIPRPAHALFGLDFVRTIADSFGRARDAAESVQNPIPHVFPFGGLITDTSGGCFLKFTIIVCTPVGCFPGPGAVPFPDSTTLVVGRPGLPSPGEIFTFPGVTKVLPSYNEGKRNHWTLGLGWTPFPIDQINSALDLVPAVSTGVVTFLNFHLDCSDSNQHVVLLIGTSGSPSSGVPIITP
jgi:hypothetical protein